MATITVGINVEIVYFVKLLVNILIPSDIHNNVLRCLYN